MSPDEQMRYEECGRVLAEDQARRESVHAERMCREAAGRLRSAGDVLLRNGNPRLAIGFVSLAKDMESTYLPEGLSDVARAILGGDS